MFKEMACVSLVAATAGCATVARGTTELVQFQSSPPGAVVTTTEGLGCPATPCAIKVDRKSDFIATFALPEYHPHQVYVGTHIPGEGAAAVAGNIVIGGVVGLATDAITGAGLDHKPNPVNVVLIPVDQPAPPPAEKPKAPEKQSGPSLPVS